MSVNPADVRVIEHGGVKWTVRRDTGARTSSSVIGAEPPSGRRGLHFSAGATHLFLEMKMSELPDQKQLQSIEQRKLSEYLERARPW